MDCINHEECKSKNLDLKQIITCDECSRAYCKLCAGIAPTEIRVMELAKRRLRYHCPTCSLITNNLELLNNQLKEENNILKRQLQEQTSMIGKLESLEYVINKSHEAYMHALQETTVKLQLNYQNELTAVKNEIKNIRESNVDLVRLLTTTDIPNAKSKCDSPFGMINIDKNNVNYETHTATAKTMSPNVLRGTARGNNLPLLHNATKLSYSETIKKRTDPNNTLQVPAQQSANRANYHTNGNNSQITDTRNQDSEDVSTGQNTVNTDVRYQVVRRRRRKINIGSGDGDQKFHGKAEKNRKIWLFVTRVPDDVGVTDIKNYIETHTKIDNPAEPIERDIEVKLLDTNNTRPNNQSFMIGVEPEFQEEVYKASFWPRKVAFERFDFRRGQHFLRNIQESHDSKQPSSFLSKGK